MDEALIHQPVAVLLVHTLCQYSIGSHVVLKGSVVWHFGQRTAEVWGSSEDYGLENIFIFLELSL